MDIFDEEVLNFWKALRDTMAEYILVGDFAANFYGYQRFTADMDIWLYDTLENRKRLRLAFKNCNMGDFPLVETIEFVPGWTEFYLNNGIRLNILTEMKGLEGFTFDECLQIASVAKIDGVDIPFLHINQLIQNKKVVNRAKDQLDVTALEAIKKLKEDT